MSLSFPGVMRRVPAFVWPQLVRDHYRDSKVPAEIGKVWSHATFTSDWYSDNAGNLLNCLKDVAPTATSFLEVGAWEGRSTLLLLSALPSAKGDVVDVWWGPRGASAEATFQANVLPYKDRIAVLKEPSSTALPRLRAQGKTYDVVHIDGDHRGDAVLLDAMNAFPMLERGGIVIFDDFLLTDPEWPVDMQPWSALGFFLRMFRAQTRVVHAGYQLVVQKV